MRARLLHRTYRNGTPPLASAPPPYHLSPIPNRPHFLPPPQKAISVWSNNRAVPNANANSFSSDESGSDEDSVDSYAGGGGGRGRRGSGTRGGGSGEGGATAHGNASVPPRSVYRNSLRLSRKWVRKSVSAGRLLPPPNFVALATSPCGCMFAAACKGSDEVTLWLRRRNMPTQGKPWENSQYGGSQVQGYPMAQHQQQAAGGAGSGGQGEGPWTFQPATVLATGGPLAQVVWGRGPGAQQDYLLTLGEDGRCPVGG